MSDVEEETETEEEEQPETWRERASRLWHRLRPPRARCPTVLQMEAAECGAASLAMILGHFGKFVSLQELRVACGVSRDGSKASNIAKAAERYGLNVSAYKVEVEEIDELPLPAILHWNFDHFLVLEGRSGDRFFLNDPGSGPTVVRTAEFDRTFTGVALTFEVNPEVFQVGGAQPNLINSLRDRIPSIAPAIAFAVIAGLGVVVSGVVIPAFMRIFIDDVLAAGKQDWAAGLVLGLVLTALFRAAMSVLGQQALLRAKMKLSVVGASSFMWRLLRLPAGFFLARRPGDLASRLMATERLADTMSTQFVGGVINLLCVIFYAAILAWLNLTLTGVVLASALANVVLLRLLSRRSVDQSRALQQDAGKLMSVATGGLQLIESLKANGGESAFFSKWSGYQAKVSMAEQRLGAMNSVINTLPTFIGTVTNTIILGLGVWQVMEADLTVGSLVAFQSLAASFLGPFAGLMHLSIMLQEAEAQASRLDDIVLAKPDPQVDLEVDGENAPVRLAGHVILEDVTFGYSPLEPPLIESFSLSVEAGRRVALVGGSGSGKSTLAKLISGLYEPWSGRITFDGFGRQQIPRNVFVNSVAVVDQEIFLFEGTVRENLTLWDDSVSEAAMVSAAKDACIHGDIVSRIGGFASEVEEGGRNFSGGQRQRMEIARALVVSPSVLLLDEATSALDPTTELIIDDNLRRRGTTCIIVAHRLSTIRDCDEIVVLDHGKVAERGTHDELIALNGKYATLVRTDLSGDAA